jgi:hypothetical protein
LGHAEIPCLFQKFWDYCYFALDRDFANSRYSELGHIEIPYLFQKFWNYCYFALDRDFANSRYSGLVVIFIIQKSCVQSRNTGIVISHQTKIYCTFRTNLQAPEILYLLVFGHTVPKSCVFPFQKFWNHRYVSRQQDLMHVPK